MALQNAAWSTPSLRTYFGSPGFRELPDDWQGWSDVVPDYTLQINYFRWHSDLLAQRDAPSVVDHDHSSGVQLEDNSHEDGTASSAPSSIDNLMDDAEETMTCHHCESTSHIALTARLRRADPSHVPARPQCQCMCGCSIQLQNPKLGQRRKCSVCQRWIGPCCLRLGHGEHAIVCHMCVRSVTHKPIGLSHGGSSSSHSAMRPSSPDDDRLPGNGQRKGALSLSPNSPVHGGSSGVAFADTDASIPSAQRIIDEDRSAGLPATDVSALTELHATSASSSSTMQTTMPNFLTQAKLQETLTSGRSVWPHASHAVSLPEGQTASAVNQLWDRQNQSVFPAGNDRDSVSHSIQRPPAASNEAPISTTSTAHAEAAAHSLTTPGERSGD